MTHTYNNITAPESFLTEKFSEAVFAYLAQNGFEHFCLKAVLFDMDGVLFDSMPNHAKSWAEVGQRFRLGITAEDAYLHEGRTGASTINSFARRDWGREATTEEIEEIYAEKCRLFNKCEMAQNMPGAERVLNAVRDAGLQILVVTEVDRPHYLSVCKPTLLVFSTPTISYQVKTAATVSLIPIPIS